MPDRDELHAIVLADGPHAGERVVGLPLRERGRRVAGRAGATRILVVATPDDRAAIAGWWAGGARLLVIRAGDQLVHTPLVTGLVAADAPRAVAVVPEAPAARDLPPGAYAGAIAARGADADALARALAAGEDDRAIAAAWLAAGAAAAPHGEVARHPATTRDERRAAARLLYRIVHKPQDNAITRWLYRPLSFPLTRLAVHTPITPNQVSYLVAVMVAIGLWLTARGPITSAIAGSVVILAASYVDCVDGEVARLKLLSSRFGAWLDTIVDELTSIGQMVALGIHARRWFGPDFLADRGLDLGVDPWLLGIAIGVATYAIVVYVVYYNIIVVIGSANSQDYVARFEVVAGERPGTVRLRPVAPPPAARRNPVLEFLPNVVRRDFICWGTVALAIAHLTHLAFATMVLGGAVTAAIVAVDHARLRAQRRAIARDGKTLLTRSAA